MATAVAAKQTKKSGTVFIWEAKTKQGEVKKGESQMPSGRFATACAASASR